MEPVHLSNSPIVTNASMTTTINSIPTNIDAAVSYSVQAVMTGSPTGVIILEASLDVVTDSTDTITNWTPITDSEVNITQSGTYMVNYELPSYSWVRLVYTPSGGNGTMNARINMKRR